MKNLLGFGICSAQMLREEKTGDKMGESCADIDGFSKPGKTIAEKAAAELLKEQEEAKIAETKNQLSKDAYRQGSEKLLLRKQRAEEKAQKEKLAAIDIYLIINTYHHDLNKIKTILIVIFKKVIQF